MLQILVILGSLFSVLNSDDFPFVETKLGPIIGIVEKYHDCPVQAYLGVPYAVPPIGELRFKKPLPLQRWTTPYMANRMPSSCYQTATGPFPSYVDSNLNEDCLYLNIWLPKCFEERPLSVMYWIHGGGLQRGSISSKALNGKVLAAVGNVIVVSVSYRLDALGFLYSASDDAPGNMGLFDMLEGLKWVHANIEAFGGNSKSITIFGSSAGSQSVGLFILSPLAKPFFNRAIMQSESAAFPLEHILQTNLNHSQLLAKALTCADDSLTVQDHPKEVVSCLKGVEAAKIVKISQFDIPHHLRTFSIQSGDELVQLDPSISVRMGHFNGDELLIGNTVDEGSLFIATSNPEIFGFHGQKRPIINKEQAFQILSKMLAFNTSKNRAIIDFYLGKVKEYKSAAVTQAVYEAFGDTFLVCPQVYFAERFAAKRPTFYYLFSHRRNNSKWDPSLGVIHSSEMDFVFGQPQIHPTDFTEEEQEFGKRIMLVWSNFAKYGSPGDYWPTYSRSEPFVQVLNTSTSEILFGLKKENCDFLRTVFNF